jgi:predicted enzyme related to lactoylglutathione lyase
MTGPNATSARIAFPKLFVRDLRAAAEFHKAVLGFQEGPTLTGDIAGRPVEEIVLLDPAGGPSLLVITYTDSDAVADPGGVILGVYTPDLDAFETRVLAAGGSVVQSIGPMEMPGHESRLAFYADLEGFLIEVIEG